MNRRQLLVVAGTGALASVSGCLDAGSAGDDDPATNDGSPHEIGETVTTEHGTVTVEAVDVQKSVIDRAAFRILHREDGVQYLLVEAGSEPPDFVPVFDDTPTEPVEQYHPTGPDTAYVLGVDVDDAERAETAAIALERDTDVRWALPSSTLDRLALRPEIRVLDAAVVERNGESSLRLELENAGERDGVFRGIVISPVGVDLDDEIVVEVPKNETVTETIRNDVTADWGTGYDLGSIDPEQRSFGKGG